MAAVERNATVPVSTGSISSEGPSIVGKVTSAIKSAYSKISGDIMVLTFIVSNLIKGAQGIGIINIASGSMKQLLGAVSSAAAAYESIEATIKTSSVFKDRAELFAHVKKPDPSKSLRGRVKDLRVACKHVKENGKALHKAMKIDKAVKLSERAKQVLTDIRGKRGKERRAAVEKGEEFVKTLRRRANTQLGFSLANMVTRISALALSLAVVITAANPITLTLSGVLGLAVLSVVVGQKIMLPANPFDAPDKESKLQTLAFKIRNAVYNASERMEAFFNRSRAVAA